MCGTGCRFPGQCQTWVAISRLMICLLKVLMQSIWRLVVGPVIELRVPGEDADGVVNAIRLSG